MAETKDPTEVIGAGNSNCNVWLADVGTAYPATLSATFTATTGWDNLGVLKDPPSPARDLSTNDIGAWNLDEPVATLPDSDSTSITLTPAQCTRLTFDLYFGKMTWTTITGGIHGVPSGALVEKALCLELIDGLVGGKIFRWCWPRCTVSDVGALNMDKADIVNFEFTLKRLTPASGPPFFIDSNIAPLVTP